MWLTWGVTTILCCWAKLVSCYLPSAYVIEQGWGICLLPRAAWFVHYRWQAAKWIGFILKLYLSSNCEKKWLLMIYCLSSDMTESFLSSHSHLEFFRVRVMIWSSRIRVESPELSNCFESLVCKLESMLGHTKFNVFSMTLFCYEMAPIMP